jgi:IS30 family transposase
MAGRALSIEQREELASSLAEDPEMTWTEVGRRAGVHRTTVARDVRLNGGRRRYCAVVARYRAQVERRRPRPGRLCAESALRRRVTAELVACRSPAAIAADLAAEGRSEGVPREHLPGHLRR